MAKIPVQSVAIYWVAASGNAPLVIYKVGLLTRDPVTLIAGAQTPTTSTSTSTTTASTPDTRAALEQSRPLSY